MAGAVLAPPTQVLNLSRQGAIDETPSVHEDIDADMAAQADLVEIVHALRQVVCVKG